MATTRKQPPKQLRRSNKSRATSSRARTKQVVRSRAATRRPRVSRVSKDSPLAQLLRRLNTRPVMLTSVLLFAAVGAIFVLVRAAGSAVTLEAESGALSGLATIQSDSAASGGKYIQFGQATPLPEPAPTPEPTPSPTPTPTPPPVGTSGSIQYVNSTTGSTGTLKTTTLHVPVPTGYQAGDVMLAMVTGGYGKVVGIPSGWKLIKEQTRIVNGGIDLATQSYYKVASSSEPTSYTWTLGQGTAYLGAATMLIFRGVDTANPVYSVTIKAETVGKDIAECPSADSPIGGMLVCSWAYDDPINSINPPASMTRVSSFMIRGDDTHAAAYEKISKAGQTGTRVATLYRAPDATENKDGNDFGQAVVLRPAAGSTSGSGDTAVPSVNFASPSAGSTVKGIVPVQVSASDNVGVTKIEFWKDGIKEAESTSASLSWSWDTSTQKDNTSHTLEAKAFDAAGNVGRALISVNVSFGGTAPAPTPTPTPTPTGWNLNWSDEFNGSGLVDGTKWGYEKGYVRNKEPQFYTVARTENARQEGGNLIIEARKESYTGATKGITSASIHTKGKKDFLFGRLEIRAKLPQGLGGWPAFWTLGTNMGSVGWPTCGEIDIFEYFSKRPDEVKASIHTAAFNHRDGTQKNAVIAVKPYADFHVYALEWFPDHLDVYLDSTKYFTFKKEAGWGNDKWPFDKPQYVLLNLAMGSFGSGTEGSTNIDASKYPYRYIIDYFRYYTK